MDINKGGPAFPTSVAVDADCNFYYGDDGMSLRDWFAGQTLVGLIASPVTNRTQPAEIAEWCYQMADSMIAEMSKK